MQSLLYPHFTAAVRALARTNAERAAIIGCSERAVILYMQGKALPHVVKVKRIPELDHALTRDIRGETSSEEVHIPA